MRISTPVFYKRNTDTVVAQQNKLSDQNVHLSSQKRVMKGSDDAVAISTIQRLKQDLSIGDQYIENGELAATANGLEETALTQVTTLLQRSRELLVTVGNTTYNAENREAVAKELEEIRNEMVGVANTKDGNSQYIFSGFEVDTQPFQRNEFGHIDYHGDTGNKSFKVGAGVYVQGNDSGHSVFVDVPEGNGTFVSEANSNNVGSGVIDEASVIDNKRANGFLSEDYTVAISQSSEGEDPKYAVYGLKAQEVTGNAHIKIAKIDTNNPNFSSVDPAYAHPELNSDVKIQFLATPEANKFEVQINGQSSMPVIYDASNGNKQAINVNGIAIEVDGIPAPADQYNLTKYIEPTLYQEGQSIEFNGIKTEIKGEVRDLDNFTLRQSGSKDIFSSIQDSIDALRLPGEAPTDKAQREIRLDMSRHQIDNTMKNISSIRTSVGARMRTIDNQHESTQDFKLTTQTTLSNLEDLDMASAISEFSMQKNLLDVTQQTFVKLQDLSLFKLI